MFQNSNSARRPKRADPRNPSALKDALAWASRRAGLSESATSVDDLLAQLPPLTPEQELEADAAWQVTSDQLGELVRQQTWAEQEARERMLLRTDVTTVSDRVARVIFEGQASSQLEASWRCHLFGEQYRRPIRCVDDAPQLRWKEAPPERLEQLIADEVYLSVVPTLGRDIAAVTFVGPWRTRVVLGRDAFFDELEAEFLAYHMYLHSLGDLPIDGFGMWVEYKRDVRTPELLPVLKNAQLRESEARVNDAASCLLFDEYVAGHTMHALSRSVIKHALARGIVTGPDVRSVLRNRVRVREAVQRLLTALYAPIAHTAFGAFVRPSLAFNQRAAVVREAWWQPIYLIGMDDRERPVKRRIPSRKVLTALGLRLCDIAPVSSVALGRYEYSGLLIDPNEVLTMNKVLADSTLALPGYRSARVRNGIDTRFAMPAVDRHCSRRFVLEERNLPKEGGTDGSIGC